MMFGNPRTRYLVTVPFMFFRSSIRSCQILWSC